MAGTRKCGNEPFDSIKCGEIFDKQNHLASVLKKDIRTFMLLFLLSDCFLLCYHKNIFHAYITYYM